MPNRITHVDDLGKLTFGNNVRRLREAQGFTQEELADKAGLDRSYVGGIERGERNPSLSVILSLASALKTPPGNLFAEIGEARQESSTSGRMSVTNTGTGLTVKFRYDQYDAEYTLPGATSEEFNDLLDDLRVGLAPAHGRSNTVSKVFLQATCRWPEANPSDLWTFVINRAYCDHTNHPETSSRLNLEQSWKRTSGWALERVLVAHYAPLLKDNGVSISIGTRALKSSLLGPIGDPRIVPDKADIVVTYEHKGNERLLGVVHVKASIAERRTDDVRMSQALINAGYLSVFWTMDVKSFPSPQPANLGEFGEAATDDISDKRKDFEEHGHFSACFSYNSNTLPTPTERIAQARIFVCDFTNPDDHFVRFLIDAFSERRAL